MGVSALGKANKPDISFTPISQPKLIDFEGRSSQIEHLPSRLWALRPNHPDDVVVVAGCSRT
jgi:hypothetical protein